MESVSAREDDLLSELLALLPPGDAIPTGFDSEIAKNLRITARSIDRLLTLADFVIENLDPRETTLFLADWENDLGLPECGTILESTIERRAAVVEKHTRVGSLTKSDLIAAAAVIGFDIAIVEHFPYPPDSDGSPEGDAHIFDVVLSELTVNEFRVGESRTGDSLGSFGDERLTCLLDARKPAHLNYRLTVP